MFQKGKGRGGGKKTLSTHYNILQHDNIKIYRSDDTSGYFRSRDLYRVPAPLQSERDDGTRAVLLRYPHV